MAMILVVEDEPVLSRNLARALEASGHEVRVTGTVREGLALARESAPDLVLLDLRLPDGSGLDLLQKLLSLDPSIRVLLMTGYGTVQEAVEAMRQGAVDYLQKPLDLDEVRLLVDRTLSRQRQDRELDYHRERGRATPAGVIGEHPELLTIFAQLERLRDAGISPGRRPAILLTGESGTGKGLVARAMHEMLGGGPFIELNCAAMPSTLVEAELFGHERGSFTDARTSRTGLFEAADGGSILLDEIGSLELAVQAKFLKVVEEKRVRRIGSVRDRAVDVQVIAATNSDLDRAVKEGTFRADLLHRLRVLSFDLPPLRERKGDILLLARHFASQLGRLYSGRPRMLEAGAEQFLVRYAWPGNVRELRNVIERAVLLGPDEVLGATAFSGLLASSPEAASERFELPEEGIDLAALERDLLRQALERTRGNRTRAAALVGITRDTLRYRLEKFELD